MIDDPKKNDLFFVCSLIELVARTTKNQKKFIVEKLGVDKITKLYYLAEVYHSENIDKVVNDLIEEKHISFGNYDSSLYYENPSYLLACYKEHKIL